MANPPLVARLNPLPVELAPALADRRRALARGVRGRVLDLGEWDDHHDAFGPDWSGEVVRVADPSQLDGVAAFDTVLSMVRTPLVADLAAYLARLDELLAPDGRVGFVEPTVRTGRSGRLVAAGGRMARAAGGLHLDRDVPHALRTHGFVVTDLDRFTLSSVAAPLRPFVAGWARRPLS